MKMLLWLVLPLVVLEANAEPRLKGSPESQMRQNAVADYYGLVRIENDEQLEEMIRSGQLVKIPNSIGIKTDERLKERLRYVLPCVADWLIELGKKFHEKFGTEIQINSGVRTISYQDYLISVLGNPNAAPVIGAKRSVHLTGAAIDIAKLPLTKEQLVWLRKYLVNEEMNYKAEITEEFRQAVFHAMVFPEAVAPHILLAANSK